MKKPGRLDARRAEIEARAIAEALAAIEDEVIPSALQHAHRFAGIEPAARQASSRGASPRSSSGAVLREND
jgi:hypothetical protein